jgi:glycogen debranching enzyme
MRRIDMSKERTILGFVLVALFVPIERTQSQTAIDSLTMANRNQRGEYFSKKIYDEAMKPLPTFQACRSELPSPILKGNPEMVAMYWKCWELAFGHLRKVRAGSPFVSDYIDEAFNDNIFQWDTIFMVMFARYANIIFPAVQSLDNFYGRQHNSGYICREISERTGEDFVYEGRKNTINPPLFSWAEVESFNITGDKSRFSAVLPVLVKYVEWLNRDGNLVSSNGKDWEQYGRRAEGSKHHLYWNTGLGSGMDNTPRGGDGWADMSCQMVIQYNNLAHICDELGLADSARTFRASSKEIADRINRWCWNDKDGYYYDVDSNGVQVKWKTAGTFWPLLAGVANKTQAERLVEHLQDPKTFWRPFVFPTLAADQKGYDPNGGYWLGGVWAPTNYMIIKGLENNGYEDFAAEATTRYLTGMAKVFQKTGTVWENYAPDSLEPGKPAKGDFVGWSGCGPIALLIENVLGFRCDGVDNRLTWYLRRTDQHGIERLHFGTTTVSAIYNPSTSKNQVPTITVKTNHPFELVIVHNRIRTSYRLQAGTHTFHVRQTEE